MEMKFARIVQSKPFFIAQVIVSALLLWVIILNVVFKEQPNVFKVGNQLPQPTLGNWNWFYKPLPQKQQPKRKVVKKSKISAELVGLIYTPDRRVALIIIKNKPLGVYTEGSVIEQGFILKYIEHDRVIIDENGEERELLIKKALNQLLVDQVKEKQETATVKLAKTTLKSNQTLNIQKIDNNRFSEYVDVYKVKVDDENNGLFLKSVDSFVSDISGIEPEDIIVDVDSRSIFDIINNRAAVMQLIERENVQINILRNGQQQVIDVNIKDITSKLLPLLNK